jgi:hypothetical protein
VKKLALASIAALVLAALGLGANAAPALAANHAITLTGPSVAAAGQSIVVRTDGVVAPPAEFWDMSWIEVVAISGTVMSDCPADAGSGGVIAEETGGVIITIALRPYANEAGNFSNAVGFTPRVPGPVLICGYLYNEVGYTWAAAATFRLNVGGASSPGGSGSSGAAGPVNVTQPWVTRAGPRIVCHPGTWSNATGAYSYRWLLDRRVTRVTGKKPYAPRRAHGHRVSCRVTASGPDGATTTATSPPLRLR